MITQPGLPNQRAAVLPGAHRQIAALLAEAYIHHDSGRLEQAEALYRRILGTLPGHPDALHFLGVASLQRGRDTDAAELIGQAVSANPSDTAARINLGNALKRLGNLEAAAAQYRSALELKPGLVEAHFNLGVVTQAQGRFADAEACYRTAIALRPGYGEAHGNLGNTLRAQGRLEEAVTSFHLALQHSTRPAIPYSSLLFHHAYHATVSPAQLLALARGWEQACLPARERATARSRTFTNLPLDGRKLRIGYVSGDFCQHPVAYFIEQLFAQHDRNKIELFAYTTNRARDAVTERLHALSDHWVPIADLPDGAARDRIEADGIDVLVDLSGHTLHNRMGMFARRAAPVQAHYLGYFASTGLSQMDHFIGDAMLTPPETDAHFCEQVWRLPRVRASYEGDPSAPRTAWQPASDGSIWVGSFNNLGKLTSATLALWAKVLHALPEGRLLLKNKGLAAPANRQRILGELIGHGIAPQRIELLDSSSTPGWREHMACYDRLDIALDPVGAHGGYTTTCDALWMGAPVITLEGNRMASRMSASILRALGYPEWVARSESEYVEKTVALAQNVALREALRPDQRAYMAASPLCDAKDLATSLEAAYFEMFERWYSEENE